MPKLTLTLRDDESDLEVKAYIEVPHDEAIGSVINRLMPEMLKGIGHGAAMPDKLDHDQDQTDSLQKSVHPDNDYMKSEGLCTKCHGPSKRCVREDCPN